MAAQAGYFDTLRSVAGKVFTYLATITLNGTDGSTLNVGAGGTLGTAAYTPTTDYAPAAGSTNIVTVGAVSGTSLTTSGQLKQLKSGVTTKASSSGSPSGFTPGASKTMTVTFANEGGFFVLSDQSAGKVAFGFLSWVSGTVTLLTGSDAMFVNTGSPGAAEVSISKSANSATVSIITGSGMSDTIAFQMFGDLISSVTDPA